MAGYQDHDDISAASGTEAVDASVPAEWSSRIRELAMADPRALVANPLNPKIHHGLQREALSEALAGIGWVSPVVVNRATGMLVDGHGRVEEAIAAGVTAVPVLYVELDPEEELQVLATLDPIRGLASYDGAKLRELIGESDVAEVGALGAVIADLVAEFPVELDDETDGWFQTITEGGDGQDAGASSPGGGDVPAAGDGPRTPMLNVICPGCFSEFEVPKAEKGTN